MRKIWAVDHAPHTEQDVIDAANAGAIEIVSLPCPAAPDFALGYNEIAEPGDDPLPVLKAAAQAALDGSDLVALRCFKAGVPFPQEWKDYVTALRAVVRGASTMLPERPDFPQET